MKIKEVSTFLDELFPIENCSDLDNGKLGFVIGDKERELSGILLALDLTKETLQEAIENNCNLIITHHPFLFFPTSKVLIGTEKGDIINLLMKNDISVYSMHTNLDVGAGGVNEVICELLNIKMQECEAIKNNFLRFGEIKPMKLKDFAKFAFEKLGVEGARIVGDLNKEIKTVGVIGGGSGSDSFVMQAIEEHLDLYICGEARLSAAQNAYYNGLCLMEINHGVEKNVMPFVKKYLEDKLKVKDKILVSRIDTDPLKYLLLKDL